MTGYDKNKPPPRAEMLLEIRETAAETQQIALPPTCTSTVKHKTSQD